MHQDQNSARLGTQRQLLQMVLNSKLQEQTGHDVQSSRASLASAMRGHSPSLQADDIQGASGYPDVDGMGPHMFGSPAQAANSQLRRAAEEAFAAQIEDR